MKNKIQDILSLNLKNYSQDDKEDIIQRLAIIGLRTLQLEQKEPLQMDHINKISNQIVESMDESGNLRKELTSIKEQLSKLSNRFEILSSEKKQNTDSSLNYSSHLSNSQSNSVLKYGNLIPPQPPSKQNLQLQKENRQNQFLSQQRLLSLPNSTSNKALNTPQSNQKLQSNSQTRSSSQHKLFETEENSLVRAKNMTKKPSSAWRNGERSNSLNQQGSVNEENQRSNSEEGNAILSNLNDSESTDIQRRRFMKNHEQIAPKITETVPSTMRFDSVKTTTRHHLDDKHIKDALFCMKEEPIEKRSSIDSQEQMSKQRKKWEQNSLQQQQPTNQYDKNNIVQESPLHEYVSLSQHQQFLPPPPPPIQPSQTQLQNYNSAGPLQQQNSYQNTNNPNFTSPKFKDGRENSMNTQFNTTEQKKGGNHQFQSAQQNKQQVIHIQNQPSIQQINQQPYQQQQQQQSQQQQQQQQQKKGNNNNQQNQVQQKEVQQPQQQTKYATTKSLQKKVEINKQKKSEESKKQNQQTQKKQQPLYLKNVTSKIKEEIRQQKESVRGGFNHDVEFVIKEKGIINPVGNKNQTRVVKGSELEQQEEIKQNQRIYDGYQHTQEDYEDEYNNYYNQQQQQTDKFTKGYQPQKVNTYNGGYSNTDIPSNYEQEEEEEGDSSYQINNYNLRRNEHKLIKQSSNQQQYLGSGNKYSTEIPPVPIIDESYSDFRNNCAQSQSQQQNYQFLKNEENEDQYSTFDQKSSYTPSNYEEMIRNNNSNNNYNYYQNKSNFNDENFNNINIPNYSQMQQQQQQQQQQLQQDKSTSNLGEQNSFNYRYNDQSSFYSNNTKMQYDQQSHNNVNNITSNSQNLSTIAHNMMQSPIISQLSNLKQNKRDSSTSDQDQFQPRSKKFSQSKPLFSDQSTYPHSNNGQPYINQQNGFDQFNDSYQNTSSLQQSVNNISYKKTVSNPPYQPNVPENLDQSSMIQDNYDQQNRSINSSLSSFKLDNNMKEVLQKDRLFFQKMFEGDDQFSHQKFDNTFTSHHQQSYNNYGHMLSSKSQARQIADFNNSSNNKMRDDSMIDNNQFNPTRYSQIQQKMEGNQGNNDFQFEDDDADDGGAMMDKRLCNFFAEQQ